MGLQCRQFIEDKRAQKDPEHGQETQSDQVSHYAPSPGHVSGSELSGRLGKVSRRQKKQASSTVNLGVLKLQRRKPRWGRYDGAIKK